MSQGSGDGVPAYSGEPENWAGAGLERREQKEKYPALPSRAPPDWTGASGPLAALCSALWDRPSAEARATV